MSDTQVTEQEAPSRIQVVTSENFQAYVDDKLGVPPAKTPEETAAEELADLESKAAEKKKSDEDVTHDIPEVPKEKKGKLNERFSELTAARKAAEEKAAKALDEVKAAREERETAQRERDELRAKYEPPKSDEIGPEPLPSQFQDVNEYAKALKDWTADKTTRDYEAAQDAKRQEADQKAVVKAWNKRLAVVKSEVADYAEVIEASDVKLSDQARDAILESDVGPQILYHLAKNPEVAEQMRGMTVKGMLREVGRLEERLSDKQQTAPEKKQTVAQISKAPAPISPVRGASPTNLTKVGSDGEWHGTYDEYKAARAAGKIKMN